MVTLKNKNYFFSIVLFTLISCQGTNSKYNLHSPANDDTDYNTSTAQLKSNHIPDSVFDMISLRHLSITGMDCDYGDNRNCWGITEIPAQIAKLGNLRTITLNVDGISTIPRELAELKNLVSIDLSDNPALADIHNITKIKSLQSLCLYGCGLKKLPIDIGELKNLTYLGLKGNAIDKTEQLRIKKALPNCEIRF